MSEEKKKDQEAQATQEAIKKAQAERNAKVQDTFNQLLALLSGHMLEEAQTLLQGLGNVIAKQVLNFPKPEVKENKPEAETTPQEDKK